MVQRILVTGGAGFIGSNFVALTRAKFPDARVVVLDSLTYAANPNGLAAPLVVGSITDEALVDSLVAESDLVVNFAAESHNDNSLRDPMAFVHTNIVGTVTLAQACVRHGVRLHHISTDEVFGDLELGSPEKFHPDTPYCPSSPYSASKASSDHFVRAFVRSFGLKATISNCSNNYGPRQHPEKFIPRQILQLIHGQPPRLYGSGEQVRDWIHVADHNEAVWAIIERGTIGETYLIGADGERSNRQVVADLLQIFGKPEGFLVHVTDRPGHDQRYAIDATSTRALGWEPKFSDFHAGLEDAVRFYQDNRWFWARAFAASEENYRAGEQVISG